MANSQQLELPGLETFSPFYRQPKHDWSDLRQLYLIEGKSLGEIARLKGTTDCTVLYALRKLCIPRRSLGQAIALTSQKDLYSHRAERNPAWKGGKYRTKSGYVHVYLTPNDPFFCMVGKKSPKGGGHVLEHRLVMARAIGKPLKSWQRVHHKNGIKDDNRIENLRLFPWGGHSPTLYFKDRIRDLETRVTLLEAENTRLITQLEDGDPDHA